MSPFVLKVNVPAVVAFPVRPKTWNLALLVAVPPTNRSLVILVGDNAPLFNCQNPEIVPEEIIFCTYKLFHSCPPVAGLDPKSYRSVVLGIRLDAKNPFAVMVSLVALPKLISPFKLAVLVT